MLLIQFELRLNLIISFMPLSNYGRLPNFSNFSLFFLSEWIEVSLKFCPRLVPDICRWKDKWDSEVCSNVHMYHCKSTYFNKVIYSNCAGSLNTCSNFAKITLWISWSLITNHCHYMSSQSYLKSWQAIQDDVNFDLQTD